MYPLSQEALDLFNKNYRQTAEIIFYGVDETFTITESDIILGSMTVDRTCVSGSRIEIGSAVASEFAITLNNGKGKFDNVKFEGAELYVRVGVTKYDARKWEKAQTQYVPVGYFTIDEPYRKLSTIPISALDRMVLFDKPVDWSLFTFPMTVKSLLSQTCTICNVTLGTDISDKPNSDYIINEAPTDETTYRQIIQWVAELTATCGFIDWEGKLQLSWYEPTTTKITPSERYSSDMLENDIVISGVQVIDEDSNIYLTGDDAYTFNIEGNSLIQHDFQAVSEAIYSAVGEFTYRPYECTTKPMPQVFPMDMVEYADKDGILHNTIVTNVTFVLNGNTSIQGQGETKTNSGYATANPLTKRESLIIKSIKNNLNNTLNNNVQSLLAFNELISNALGVYATVVTDNSGAKQYYMHDSPNLEDSNTIYTLNAGGYAYTNNGWNNGNPVWQYGFDKNGNAIYKKVCAYGMEVSNPNNSYSATISPEAFKIWQDTVLILDASKEGLKIFNKGITVFRGVGSSARKVLYFDSDGNIALDGYLTQSGSPYRALIGYNESGYGGFYLYCNKSQYLRADGTYKPYAEIWSSKTNVTAITGTNELHFIVTTIENESEGNFSKLDLTTTGGHCYGAWDYSQNQKFTKDIGTTGSLQLYNGDTLVGNMYQSDNAFVITNPVGNLQLGVSGYNFIKGHRENGYSKAIIYNYDLRAGSALIVDATRVGDVFWSNDSTVCTDIKSGWKWGISVGENYRILTDNNGGILYGAWDFGQEQNFSKNINAPAFICKRNGSKAMSLYISSTNNPCFNSDNGNDYYFSVGGTTRLAVRTSGGDMYGSWQINTDSGYVSLYTDQTGNGGGKLWGTWYLGNSTAITSDANKKNSVEELPEKYSTLFDNLRPVRYKYNDGTSNRYHTGFIAQEVEQALNDSEIDTQEFAGFVKNEDGECFLRYEEFIALAVNKIQTLEKENNDLEQRVTELENKLENILSKLGG